MFNPQYFPLFPQPVTVYGASGCIIRVSSKNTIKMAGDPKTTQRLLDQAQFIKDADISMLPEVMSIMPAAYSMETLHKIDWENVEPRVVMTEMREKLEEQLWSQQPSDLHDIVWFGSLKKYVEEKINFLQQDATHGNITQKVAKRVMLLVDRLPQLENCLHVCKIHGDPTLDNCMLRVDHKDNVELIVTDPLPCKGTSIPSFEQVDRGKMLQSALGYEWGLNQAEWEHVPYDYADLSAAALRGQTYKQSAASYIFAVIHVVRLLPYQFKRRPKFINMLEGALSHAENFNI